MDINKKLFFMAAFLLVPNIVFAILAPSRSPEELIVEVLKTFIEISLIISTLGFIIAYVVTKKINSSLSIAKYLGPIGFSVLLSFVIISNTVESVYFSGFYFDLISAFSLLLFFIYAAICYVLIKSKKLSFKYLGVYYLLAYIPAIIVILVLKSELISI